MFYASDLITQYVPWYYLASLQLKSFSFPHWLPDIYGTGYPLLAQGETGVLSPINSIILLIFPFPTAFNLLYITYSLVAFVGMYFFMKECRLSRAGGFLGATIFLFSGFFISRYFQSSIIFTAALLPWGFFLISRSLKSEKFLLLIAPLIYLQITAGHLQIALISIFSYLVFLLLLIINTRKKMNLLPKLFLVILIGLALSSIQLLPSLKLFEISDRKNWDPMMRFSYSLPPSHLITYITPDAFGISKPGDDLGFRQFGGGFWEINLTIWTLPFFLSLIPLVKVFTKHREIDTNKKQLIFTFYVIWIIFILLSLGGFFKPNRIIAYFPDFPFRAPARFLIVTTLAAAALAGFGFEEIIKHKKLLTKILIFSIVLLSMLFQISKQMNKYFILEKSEIVVGNLKDIKKIKLTTPLPLNPSLITKDAKHLETIFRKEFYKGLAVSILSLSLLIIWWVNSPKRS